MLLCVVTYYVVNCSSVGRRVGRVGGGVHWGGGGGHIVHLWTKDVGIQVLLTQLET